MWPPQSGASSAWEWRIVVVGSVMAEGIRRSKRIATDIVDLPARRGLNRGWGPEGPPLGRSEGDSIPRPAVSSRPVARPPLRGAAGLAEGG